jgi:hypothetical protein
MYHNTQSSSHTHQPVSGGRTATPPGILVGPTPRGSRSLREESKSPALDLKSSTTSGDQSEYVYLEPKVLTPSPSFLPSMKLGIRALRPGRASSLPPEFDATPKLSRRFRFVSTNASFELCTNITMSGLLGGIATSSTSFQPWSSSFRLHRVTVWPSVNNGSSSTSVQMFWEPGTAGQVRDERKVISIPEGVSITEPSIFTPPSRSLASDWLLLSQAANLFEVASPPGSILDLQVEFTLSNEFSSSPITVSGATTGSAYYLAMDGAAGTYTPIGVPTVT